MCKSAIEALWPVLADTDRLNRLFGMPPLDAVEPLQDAGAARFLVQTRLGGLPASYEEQPFEFREHEWLFVRRIVRDGPARSLRFGLRFERRDGGTAVRPELESEVRSPLFAPFARLQLEQARARVSEAIGRIDETLLAARPVASLGPAPERIGDRLAQPAAELRARVVDTELPVVERVLEHLRTAPDVDVARIRPFPLADAWGVDRAQALSVALHATLEGLLRLDWALVCPSCRGASEELPNLADLPSEGHCQLCDVRYGLDLDRAIEAVFRPTARIRRVDPRPFCIGGPARLPHVLEQRVLPSRGEVVLQAPTTPGTYRLFARGGATGSLEITTGGEASGLVRLAGGAFSPSALTLAPGAALRVTDGDGRELHVKLERLPWTDQAATALQVTNHPTFRRFFASQVLKPGVSLKVARVTLLFSDLTDSTAFYASAGDAAAFQLVQEHFALIREELEAQGGVLVKTIGDAVMAAFLDTAPAVRAAMALQRRWPSFRAGHAGAERVSLKLGLHAGPCYAVNANGLLDYFGQTVNVAARLQGQAAAGELVLSEALWARAASDVGPDAQIAGRFVATLKGVTEPIPAVRLLPA